MADKTVLGLSTNFLLIGLFLVSLVTGYFLIVADEGQEEILEGYEIFGEISDNLSSYMTNESVILSNKNMNLSSAYNPELAISAADQTGNAMSLNMFEVSKEIWSESGKFFGLLFGSVWTKTISLLLISILVLTAGYYSVKWLRNGV